MATSPDLDIHLEVTDAPVDFAARHVDVALRYEDGGYAFAASERIMNETVSPACSPDYRDRMGGLQAADDLAKCQLIHETGMNTTWESWFAMIDMPYPGSRGPDTATAACRLKLQFVGQAWRSAAVSSWRKTFPPAG